MALYEIVTYYLGESYERAYVWAASSMEAQIMFEHKHDKAIKSCTKLFNKYDKPFVSQLSDCGFELPDGD